MNNKWLIHAYSTFRYSLREALILGLGFGWQKKQEQELIEQNKKHECSCSLLVVQQILNRLNIMHATYLFILHMHDTYWSKGMACRKRNTNELHLNALVNLTGNSIRMRDK